MQRSRGFRRTAHSDVLRAFRGFRRQRQSGDWAQNKDNIKEAKPKAKDNSKGKTIIKESKRNRSA
jgi:hypothetical protein